MNVVGQKLRKSTPGLPAAPQAASDARRGRPLELGIPITELVLHRLPGSRWAVIIDGRVAVLMTPFALAGAKWLAGSSNDIDGLGELAPQGILTYVVVLLLVGVARLVDQASALRPDIERLTNYKTATTDSTPKWNVAGPVVLTVVVVLVASWSSWSANGVMPTTVVLPFLALAVLPVMTFVWTYVRLLLGLDQLGRARLALEPFPQDRSLVAPLGHWPSADLYCSLRRRCRPCSRRRGIRRPSSSPLSSSA